MDKKLSMTGLDLQGKKVLMRVDFNVPLDKQGRISDDTRIVASLPSIRYVLDHGGSLILISHLGRPKEGDRTLSLSPCSKRLSEILKKPVVMAPDCVGKEVQKFAHDLKPGDILLLENLRFHPAEEKPEEDHTFAKQLAELGDVYVNDAFGTAHRAHSSTVMIARYFPNKSATGLLMEKEIQFLGEVLNQPKRPFYAIIGGAKISTKMGVLKSLMNKVDALFIGGAMAYTFFKSMGFSIGDSLYEDKYLEEARSILDMAKAKQVRVFLPQDTVIVEKITEGSPSKVIIPSQGIPANWQGVDIGPKTVDAYRAALQDAQVVFWNGPMGVFEVTPFAKGTNAIAQTLAGLQITTIVGGGESVAAVEAAGLTHRFTHLSTGGGASLEFIEFGTLPGIEALTTSGSYSLGR